MKQEIYIVRFNEAKSFFQGPKLQNKHLAILVKKKRKQTQINTNRNLNKDYNYRCRGG